MFNIDRCPDSYLRSVERDEFFEMIWYRDTTLADGNYQIYLIPPFRSAGISLEGKDGFLISFKREYLEEDDKEYALDVFNLFNLQGQISLLSVSEETQQNLEYLYKLMLYEYTNGLGSFLVVKSLLKVFLLHLIRLNQHAFMQQDVNQKRVYEFCLLLDEFYYKERKASFYAGKLGITEKRLNQILQEKMNRTITQLVHARLVLEAKRKLTVGESTIKEIAYELNFEGHSYFTRFFKKQTGLTPEDFKKEIAGITGYQNN
jgi:AraC-like DNA-binding protein